ncbi:unnamed protein product [Rotaria magnacalcarata]|uniref:Mammalian ependymin-related protein 1 n=1 Tax=Rotaria magnacalcarata TaxID=392030 RepID=A0A820C494_9BILA|nr:unnamed protein product [Rotaria magnacalcarata]CAF4211613.1 unnamed protein product [Rotaria magnacalcarata]
MLPIVLLFLVGLVVAQQPRPCASPSQWEARIISHINNENITVQGKLSYDSVYQRERFIEQVVVGDDYYYETIALFQVRLEFVINLTARNCSRLPLTRPWRDFSIRPDAHSYGEAYIGSSALPSTGLLITMWGGNYTTPSNDTVNYIGTWTYEACLPVSHTSIHPKYGITHDSFYDVSGGISDPNVFIPPRECLSDKEYAIRHTLSGASPK